jgi:hypothetical protein
VDALTPEEFEQWQRLREPPDNEVPEPVPSAALLARTDDVAVALTSVAACSTGFSFEVAVRMRHTPDPFDDPFGWAVRGPGSDGHLLVGVEFADGRRASVLDGFGWPPRPGRSGGEDDVVLTPTSGNGGGRSFDQRWWVSPLPPDGPLRVVVRWDARGLQEAVSELDGSAVAAAGRRAVQLWPWEPERPEGFEPPPPPRPASGWFAG